MLTKEDLEKCFFVPMSTMRRVVDFIENPVHDPDRRCKRSLLQLQQDRNLSTCTLRDKKWRNQYQVALCRAVHSHNWNKLLYLLRKSPIWEHEWRELDERGLYLKALLVLLMYHPNAKAQSLLDYYLHMVMSCRTEQDKMAVYKVLLTLQQKIQVSRKSYNAY